MPECNIITVSQKIEDESEKTRLINIAQKFLPNNAGAIMRTASVGISKEKIQSDIKQLIEKWQQIKEKIENAKEMTEIVYDNNTFIRRTLIDILDNGLQKIIVNDETTYKTVKEMLADIGDLDTITIELKKGEDLLEMYDLRKQTEELLHRKIWLKCGGFITIDKTEALTAIDVNSGKYTGSKDLEKTIYKVNQEATIEIAKQLRLRDIGRNYSN